ncbi:MAG: glycosyltransferase [Candidatus Brocadiae bacterium]|nr:glycosyltransferase [Candidatus Brocadiia bacterium]
MLRRRTPLWTISVLTIPQREAYLVPLLESLRALRLRRSRWELCLVYNWDTDEEPWAVERRLRKLGKGLPLSVHFNTRHPSIIGGRMQQLALCKTPLVCFIDDDLTLHGDLLDVLEARFREVPMGILGVPSLVEDTNRLFKPRRATPHVNAHGIRFMTVQGMLIAGYRRLFQDVGGFNPRRTFWGEWTELNLRMWRSGFATGYAMDAGYLRHWHDAPESPTRNKAGRQDHVLWGLLCTALEYDAIAVRPDTETFWKLVEQRYLTYSFGEAVAPADLLGAVLRLVPRLAVEWPHIAEFREMARRHPFQFAPFHDLTEGDVEKVLAYGEEHVARYRRAVWGSDGRSKR